MSSARTPRPQGPAETGLLASPWCWFLSCTLALVTCCLLFPPGRWMGAIGTAFSVAELVAICAALRMYRPAKPASWRLLAVGVALYTAANAIWYVWYPIGMGQSAPLVSVADGLYGSAYLCFIAGLTIVVRQRRGAEEGMGSLIDAAIVSTSVGLFAWVYLVQPLGAAAQGSVTARAVSLSYPILDLALATVLARVAFTRGTRPPAFWLLCGFVTSLLATDFAYTLALIDGTWEPGRSLAVGWLVASGCLAAAALHPSMVSLGDVDGPATAPAMSWRRLAFLGVAAAAVPAGLLTGPDRLSGEVLVGSMLIFGLCLARMAVLTRESRRLHVTDARFRSLFEWSNTGIVMSNLEGGYLAVNPSFCTMVGYTEAELLETGFMALTHPDDVDQSRKLVDEVVAGDIGSPRMVKRYLRKDGETIWVDIVVSTIRDDEGHALHMMATIEDITHRKAAEQALERARSLQRVAGALARVGGWALEVPGMEFYGSEELKEILSEEGGDVSLEEGLARVEEPFRGRIAASLHTCATEGTSFELEVPLRQHHVGEIWVRIVAEAQRDDDGRIARVIGAFQDVTELRRATKEYQEVAERLTMTVESITDGFCTLDRNWRFTYVNRRCEEILQRPLPNLLGISLWDQLPELVDSEVGVAYRRAMHEGSTEVLETGGPDGWFAVRIYPSAEGLAVFFQDVTEQHKAREVLRESEARLAEQAALLDEARDAIVVRDLDHRITYWNHSAGTIYGWSAEEAVGRSIRELLYPEPSAFDEATVKLLGAGGWHGELTALTKGGRELVADGRETLVHDEAGQPKSVLSIMTDITERKQRDLQYWRAQRMESIGTLAGGVAHDLNNALMPIMMAIELLQGDETDPSRLSMLDSIALGAQRATEMVRQLLSYVAGVEGRRLSIDVGGLLREVERMANDTFLKTIRIVREEASDLSPVSGDATQLNQVLVNLCVNARDAMPEGGTLVLAADNVVVNERDPGVEPTPGRYVRIRVEDDGQGMAPEVLERIFEPFYTTKAHGHGTGLGLSTSVGIIKSHGGFIRVDSTPGKGTRFLVHLPAAVDPASVSTPSGSRGRPEGNEGIVLVVDDEAQVRTMLRRGLQRAGYQVLEASSGADAVGVVTRAGSGIDVVLTDMMMPGMDGLETIRAMKAVRPDLPVVLVSGLHTPSMSKAAAELGVRHVLSKPFTITTLLQTLRDTLDQIAEPPIGSPRPEDPDRFSSITRS